MPLLQIIVLLSLSKISMKFLSHNFPIDIRVPYVNVGNIFFAVSVCGNPMNWRFPVSVDFMDAPFGIMNFTP